MSRVACALLALVCFGLLACSSEDRGSAGTPGACLERPVDLPRPPANTLPCDLIPPGLSLGK